MLSSTILVLIIFSTLNVGLRHMAQASNGTPDESEKSASEGQGTSTELALPGNEFVITLKQDESFRFAAIKSSEHDIKLQVSSSKREKSLRVPKGEYELSYKTRPVAGIPAKKTIRITIDSDETISCRIDHSEGAGCYYPDNELIK
jgi:hypothetical protein